jgi:hypothetical protein
MKIKLTEKTILLRYEKPGAGRAALLAALLAAGPAQAVLVDFGPIDPAHGYPLWYRGADGLGLELCLSEAAANAAIPGNLLCLLDPGERQEPGNPIISYPDNFWPEVFWTRVDAEMPTALGSVLLVTALEGAFANEEPVAGENISFGRIRVRMDNPVAGANLKITHPFGILNLNNQPAGLRAINVTSDVGIQATPPPPSDYSGALGGSIGPFLRWTAPDFPVLDQNGVAYIGDPNIPHTMTGSPLGTNFFRVEGPVGLGSPGAPNLCADPLLGNSATDVTDCIETDLFVGSGKIADSDADGTQDHADNCASVANPGQQDNDSDGVGNACDNCIDVANADQRNTGANPAFGNMCDADLDNNGVVNLADYSLFRSEFGTVSPLSPAQENADFDGDGNVNLGDFSRLRAMFGKAPGP